jgi:hypothetical protein
MRNFYTIQDLLRFQTVAKKSTIFWNITPCSPLKVNSRFRGTYRLRFPTTFTQVSCSAYSSLRMKTICSFETSVDFQRTTRRYTPEDSTLHNQSCENLKSYIVTNKIIQQIREFTHRATSRALAVTAYKTKTKLRGL